LNESLPGSTGANFKTKMASMNRMGAQAVNTGKAARLRAAQRVRVNALIASGIRRNRGLFFPDSAVNISVSGEPDGLNSAPSPRAASAPQKERNFVESGDKVWQYSPMKATSFPPHYGDSAEENRGPGTPRLIPADYKCLPVTPDRFSPVAGALILYTSLFADPMSKSAPYSL
jgi:hypothetical protein